jgi:hypothetical protein
MRVICCEAILTLLVLWSLQGTENTLLWQPVDRDLAQCDRWESLYEAVRQFRLPQRAGCRLRLYWSAR